MLLRIWSIHQCDVNNDFLNGDPDEKVYMIPPTGYCVPENIVCKLNKSLYGLKKETSKQWFTKLSQTLISIGFIPSKANTSLFTKSTGSNFSV